MITRMQHVHHLDGQDNHDAPASLSRGSCHTQLELFTAVDHILQHVIDCVLVNSGSLGNDLTNFATHAAEKTCGAGTGVMMWIVRKDSTQIAIVDSGPIKVITLTLAAIMFAQRNLQSRERLDFGSRTVARFRSRKLFHNLVDVFKFAQCWPAFVTPAPARTRHDPNGK